MSLKEEKSGKLRFEILILLNECKFLHKMRTYATGDIFSAYIKKMRFVKLVNVKIK